MRTLILGGTVFLGRHVAEAALARGHELTLFTRGLHGADLFPEAEHLRGDRSADVSRAARARVGRGDRHQRLQARRRGGLERGARGLRRAPRVRLLVATPTPAGRPRSSTRTARPGRPRTTTTGRPRPRASARRRRRCPGRVAAVRAGLIVGPYDGVFRLPWWVRRIAAGGEVPAPGDPARELQIVDARDLAAWMLDLAERRVAGAFNGTAPIGQTTMGELLGAAVEATGSDARLRWVPDGALRERRRRAVDGAAAVGARRTRWRRHLAHRHRARAGGRPALPPDRGDGRRRVARGCATAARRRVGLGLPRPPGADERRARAGAARAGLALTQRRVVADRRRGPRRPPPTPASPGCSRRRS